MIRTLIAFAGLTALLVTSACTSTIQPSESYYTNAETMVSASVDRCRVLEVRQVSVGAVSDASVLGSPEAQIGSAVGAIGGALIGSQIGRGNGKTLATGIGIALGTYAGEAQGARYAQKRMSRPGVEYSVLTSTGQEEIIVQNYNPGDRIAAPGSTCRISASKTGKRVLPGDQLPGLVARPAQSRFAG